MISKLNKKTPCILDAKPNPEYLTIQQLIKLQESYGKPQRFIDDTGFLVNPPVNTRDISLTNTDPTESGKVIKKIDQAIHIKTTPPPPQMTGDTNKNCPGSTTMRLDTTSLQKGPPIDQPQATQMEADLSHRPGPLNVSSNIQSGLNHSPVNNQLKYSQYQNDICYVNFQNQEYHDMEWNLINHCLAKMGFFALDHSNEDQSCQIIPNYKILSSIFSKFESKPQFLMAKQIEKVSSVVR